MSRARFARSNLCNPRPNLHLPFSFLGTIKAGLAHSLLEGSIQPRSIISANNFFMASARSP